MGGPDRKSHEKEVTILHTNYFPRQLDDRPKDAGDFRLKPKP
jgi:hypothetical protein